MSYAADLCDLPLIKWCLRSPQYKSGHLDLNKLLDFPIGQNKDASADYWLASYKAPLLMIAWRSMVDEQEPRSVVRALLASKASPDLEDSFGVSARHYELIHACVNLDARRVAAWLDAYKSFVPTFINRPAYFADTSARYECTPLEHSIFHFEPWCPPLSDELIDSQRNIIRLLVRAQADLNERTVRARVSTTQPETAKGQEYQSQKVGPLAMAILSGGIAATSCLLELGANPLQLSLDRAKAYVSHEPSLVCLQRVLQVAQDLLVNALAPHLADSTTLSIILTFLLYVPFLLALLS